MKINSYPVEYVIMGLILILSGFGIVMMYSASSIYAMNKFNNYMFFLIQQIKWLSLGFIIMLIFSKINYHIFKKFAVSLLIFSLLATYVAKAAILRFVGSFIENVFNNLL